MIPDDNCFSLSAANGYNLEHTITRPQKLDKFLGQATLPISTRVLARV